MFKSKKNWRNYVQTHGVVLHHCILPLWKGSFSPSHATRTISRIFLQLISPESALIFPSTSLLSAEYKQHFRLKQTKEANDHPWFHLFSLATPPLPDSFVKAVLAFLFMLWPSLISFQFQNDSETALVKVSNISGHWFSNVQSVLTVYTPCSII